MNSREFKLYLIVWIFGFIIGFLFLLLLTEGIIVDGVAYMKDGCIIGMNWQTDGIWGCP